MKITSTDKMNEAFKEKDEKYREWATKETRESKVVMAVMVPLIISHDGAVHKDTIRRGRNFAPDIKVDWVRMAQNVLRYNDVIVGKSSIKGAGSPKPGEKNTQKSLKKSMSPLKESRQSRNEESGYS